MTMQTTPPDAILVPLGNLSLLDGNPRVGDVKAIGESYVRFGQTKPIVANKRGYRAKGGVPQGVVIDGNHQLLAARALEWKELAVVFVDWDAEQATAYSIAANRMSQLGTYDSEALLEMLQNIDDLTGTGYTAEDVEGLSVEMEMELGSDSAPPSDGTLLAVANVSLGEPTHECHHGQVWKIGESVLVVEDVMTGWPVWLPYLVEGALFVPYPGPFVALSTKAAKDKLVMVQPETYIAGHILDKYESVHGSKKIRLLS